MGILMSRSSRWNESGGEEQLLLVYVPDEVLQTVVSVLELNEMDTETETTTEEQ